MTSYQLPETLTDQIRARFEAAWEDESSTPHLREYLLELPEDWREHALCELLWVEWEQLRSRGVSVCLDDYRHSFPEWEETIVGAWRSDFRRLARERELERPYGDRYEVLYPHACGGLGQVFVARDLELGREVALKEIKRPNSDHRGWQQRFLREARITGQLDHPGIVPVYGMGTKRDGTPFYTMRLIRGECLTAAIAAWHRSRSRRRADYRSPEFHRLLGRLVVVCQVLEFAHRRGFLHRDLKPDNIMVGEHGETVVIDWGLATEVAMPDSCPVRDREPAALTQLAFTTDGATVGTPGYMSPEQANGPLDALSPASDVYSLGATLYYVLTGVPPPRSEATSSGEAVLAWVPAPRPRDVSAAVPPPLDAICQRAMARSTTSRYESAGELAAELEHWLADAPVRACREPLLRRIVRWMRHHPAVTAAGVASLVLCTMATAALAVLTTWHNRQLEATQAVAERERDQATAIADSMVRFFRSPDPGADGAAVTAAELLERSFADLQRDTHLAPETRQRLLAALIDSHLGLGLYARAAEIGEYALAASLQHPDRTADSPLLQGRLAAAYLADGRILQAIDHFELAVHEARRRYGPDHPETLLAQTGLVGGWHQAGRLQDAIRLAKEIVAKAQQVSPASSNTVTEASYALALALKDAGEASEAIAILERLAEPSRQEHGDDHPTTLQFRNALADAYEKAGRYADSIALHETTLQSRRHRLGPHHPYTLNSQNNLALAYQSIGRYEEARKLHEETLAARKEIFGETHAITFRSKLNLATVQIRTGNISEGLKLLREITTLSSSMQMTTAAILNHTIIYAQTLSESGQTKEAIATLDIALNESTSSLGSMHPTTIRAAVCYASNLRLAGRTTEAKEVIERVHPVAMTVFGPNSEDLFLTENCISSILSDSGDSNAAKNRLLQLSNRARASLGQHHPTCAVIDINLAICLQRVNDFSQSTAAANRAISSVTGQSNLAKQLSAQATQVLIANHELVGNTQTALTLADAHRRDLLATLPADHHLVLNASREISSLLLHAGRIKEAERELSFVLETVQCSTKFKETIEKDVRAELAMVCRDSENYQEAELHYDWLATRILDTKPENLRELAGYLYWLGYCQQKQGSTLSAETSLQRCYDIRQSIAPSDWPTHLAAHLLGFVLIENNRAEQGTRLLNEGYKLLVERQSLIPTSRRKVILDESKERVSRASLKIQHAERYRN